MAALSQKTCRLAVSAIYVQNILEQMMVCNHYKFMVNCKVIWSTVGFFILLSASLLLPPPCKFHWEFKKESFPLTSSAPACWGEAEGGIKHSFISCSFLLRWSLIAYALSWWNTFHLVCSLSSSAAVISYMKQVIWAYNPNWKLQSTGAGWFLLSDCITEESTRRPYREQITQVSIESGSPILVRGGWIISACNRAD